MALKIAVLGNCQALNIGECLRVLHPDAQVMTISWADIRSYNQAEAIARSLENYDHVATQLNSMKVTGALQTPLLRQRLKRLDFLPRLYFTGFHPDAIFLHKKAGVRSPFGSFHSLLAIAAFLRNIPRQRAGDLYNAYIYGRLGYFDEYAKVEAYHVEEAHRLGIDLKPDLDRWRQQGVFMLLPNHPNIEVMWNIASNLSRNWGLKAAAGARAPADPFRRYAIWPVYPELARRLGVEGSMIFKPWGGEAAPVMKLEGVLDAAYSAYVTVDKEKLSLQRVCEAMAVLEQEGL